MKQQRCKKRGAWGACSCYFSTSCANFWADYAKNMLKYAVLILWRKKGVGANFYGFCISVFWLQNTNFDCKTHIFIAKHIFLLQNTYFHCKTHIFIVKHTFWLQNAYFDYKTHFFIAKHIFWLQNAYFDCKTHILIA